MASSSSFLSGWSSGIGGTDRTLVEPPESIGKPTDTKATAVNTTNSAFAMLKGMADALDVPVGSGSGDVKNHAHLNADPLITLGKKSDPIATNNTGTWSAISLLKGIAAQLGV